MKPKALTVNNNDINTLTYPLFVDLWGFPAASQPSPCRDDSERLHGDL